MLKYRYLIHGGNKMQVKRKIALIVLLAYLFSFAAPSLAYAADTGSVAAAAAALSGQTAGTAADLAAPSLGTDSAGASDADTTPDTGQAPNLPVISDPSASEPDTIVVNDQPLAEDKDRPGTMQAPDASVGTSGRLDPREVKGSSVYDNLRATLRRFGSDFFAVPRGNTLAYAPVGPSYVVAPGDEVKVTIWCYNDIRANLVVNRDGIITLPQAGPIAAAGLTFSELEKNIKGAYGRILNDFDINVSMGKLHTITVYVTGHAAKPGAYAVSSMATLIDVLSQAGGPALSGSMRAIQIKRSNKTVATLDVYELLLKGSRKGDIRLQEGDVVFVPTVGTLVTMAGNVKRPAIYEMKNDEKTLKAAISLAGGLTSGAFNGRIQIVRVEDHTVRTAFESDLNAPASKAQKLQDGDLIKIFAVPGGSINVRIAGAVIQPGVYAIEPGTTTLADIIKRAGGLLYTASSEGELTRIQVSEKGPVTSRMMVNLIDAEHGTSKFLLMRDDYIFVRTVPDWNLYRSASVSGRVLYPGNYAVKQGERLSSLLERAGGFAQDAFPRGALFVRDSVKAQQQQNIDEMVLRMEREMAAASNESVSTATTTKDVTFAQAEFAQKDRLMKALKNLKATGRVIMQIPDNYQLLKGSAFDIELQEGDKLYIPAIPGTIQVLGAVTSQSTFVYREGQPLTDYIKMAGGYSASANSRRTYILKPDGSTIRAFSGNKAQRVENGDFIVVPEKLTFQPKLRNATDIIDIVYKLVLGVAAVDYIFK